VGERPGEMTMTMALGVIRDPVDAPVSLAGADAGAPDKETVRRTPATGAWTGGL